jgi:hypothetical protein
VVSFAKLTSLLNTKRLTTNCPVMDSYDQIKYGQNSGLEKSDNSSKNFLIEDLIGDLAKGVTKFGAIRPWKIAIATAG